MPECGSAGVDSDAVNIIPIRLEARKYCKWYDQLKKTGGKRTLGYPYMITHRQEHGVSIIVKQRYICPAHAIDCHIDHNALKETTGMALCAPIQREGATDSASAIAASPYSP